MADHDPVDKGKVNGVVFCLLDHLDEWYGQDAQIEHVLVVARVTDAGGGRCTDVVTSAGTTKDEALEVLARAHDIYSRPAAGTGAGNAGRGERGVQGLVAERVRWVRSDEGRQANRSGGEG